MLVGGEAEEGVEEEVEEEMHELVFHKWLMAAQCCLGPLFCAAVLFGASRPFLTSLPAVHLGSHDGQNR